MTIKTLVKNARGLACALAALLYILPGPAQAEVGSATPAPGYLEKAAAALAGGDKDRARLWIACSLGETLRTPGATFRAEDLAPLLNRLGVKPTAFLSGRFDPSFLNFFMWGSWSLWACAEAPVDAARGRILMAEVRSGSRSIAFWGTPTLEERALIGGRSALTLMLLAPSDETRIVVGRYDDDGALHAEAELTLDAGPIQFIVDAGFSDMDGDGREDLLVRYNALTASGFTQVLDVFGPDDAGGFARRFRFEGEAEGYARSLGDGRVEVARGISAQGGGHLDNDRERVELWRFRDGRPVKESARTTPHRLLDKGWEAYYLGQ